MVEAIDSTRILARFVLDTTFENLDADLLRHIRRNITDCLGVGLGGVDNSVTELLLDHLRELGGSPQATVWGIGERLNVARTALVNGHLSNVLDYDDTLLSPDTILHANAALLPAALAVAEWKRRTGRELITAFAVGYEVEVRVARAVGFVHLERRWHPTSTAGTFAAAAAASKLLGLNETQICHALGIASSQASGSIEFSGGDMKGIQVGYAAQKGVEAALLAARGVSLSQRVLDDRPGCFLRLYSDDPKPERLVEGLGERWELSNSAFKAFACGIVGQPLMDGVIRLRNAHNIKPEQVAEIEGHVYPFTIVPMWRKEPKTGLEGKFSIWHSVAVCLIDGTAGKIQYSDTRVNDPLVVNMRERVKIITDEKLAAHEARAIIRLVDGRTFEITVEHGLGTRENPLTDDDLRSKFLSLAGPAIGSERANKVLNTIDRLELLGDAGDLARATVGSVD
jgi:2-methylcitrate dehydratase PrpD